MPLPLPGLLSGPPTLRFLLMEDPRPWRALTGDVGLSDAEAAPVMEWPSIQLDEAGSAEPRSFP